ncbi:MAG: hypothetical protein WCT08_03550 [Patescibacteria group bacterium]|jgi:hypothetical protein
MFKSMMITVVVVLAFVGTTFAQTPSWSTNQGGQLLVNFKLQPLDFGSGWNSLLKASVFSVPMKGFNQLFCYAGANKGILTLDGGIAMNWAGKDPFFVGFMTDVPFGRCIWSTEVDNMFNTHSEQYFWSGVDINYTIHTDKGDKAFWFGPQVEACRIGKTSAQFGARIGYDKFQLGWYLGDRGYDVRLNVNVNI